jgi:hypothetical protein
MTKFHQNVLPLLREPLSIFRLITLYQTDRYPWRFDSIHSHCHDDVILILDILKNFKEFWAIARYRAPPRHVLKMSVRVGPHL